MPKNILITGSTDGIGLETAKKLAGDGHNVILHGRSATKLGAAQEAVSTALGAIEADLSERAGLDKLASETRALAPNLDILINNAGIYKTPSPILASGHDIRFIVNTLAPYALTLALLPTIPASGRIVNLSSAAQAPLDFDALAGKRHLDGFEAYAQSKLALTAMTAAMATSHDQLFVSVNPGSLLATKMVREGFGVSGHDINIGRDILVAAALDEGFEGRSGAYYDNDARAFAPLHPGVAAANRDGKLLSALDRLLADWS
ncbi:MAG: SDR family NAD(P)-dependent oxidoreductase [Pseudomonadota bacterium]